MPEISVIIPHLNHPDFLRNCLASLLAQEDAPEFEIIVVDNGSQTLPVEVCAVDPRIRLIEEPEPGPGPARNTGVTEASAPLLAFIDADCTAAPGWLARIAGHFAAHPDQGVLGGDVFIARAAADGRATPMEAYESIYSFRMKEYIEQKNFTGTGNLAMRRSVMDRVGPFGGIAIAEDVEWGQRATSMGHPTHYVEDMIVYHPARKSFAEMRTKWFRHIAHSCTMARGKTGWQLRWLAHAAVMAGSPLGEIFYILRSDRVSGWRERGLAFYGVVRMRLYRARLMVMFLFADPEKAANTWNRG